MKWATLLPGYRAGRRSVISELEHLGGPVMLAQTPSQLETAIERLGTTGGGSVILIGTIRFPAGGCALHLGQTRNENARVNVIAEKIENVSIVGLHMEVLR